MWWVDRYVVFIWDARRVRAVGSFRESLSRSMRAFCGYERIAFGLTISMEVGEVDRPV